MPRNTLEERVAALEKQVGALLANQGLLGQGAYGEVWLALAPGNVQVAIKIIIRRLDHDDSQREFQSLELIKRLRHPYLVQTHAYSSCNDHLVIAMELADGSLRDRDAECRNAGKPGMPVDEQRTAKARKRIAPNSFSGIRGVRQKVSNLLILGPNPSSPALFSSSITSVKQEIIRDCMIRPKCPQAGDQRVGTLAPPSRLKTPARRRSPYPWRLRKLPAR
jgi:hypothetical protein